VERKHFEGDEFRGNRLRMVGTNRDEPEEGRNFVWTKEGWFERLEGTSGNVAFSHISDSEDDLRQLVLRDNPGADFFELGGDFRHTVEDEFVEQFRFFRDSANYTRQDPIEEDEDQGFHQHDL
jgi:hypothetical protein